LLEHRLGLHVAFAAPWTGAHQHMSGVGSHNVFLKNLDFY